MANEYKYDVFISYSRKDYVDENKNVIPGNIVSQITDALKDNSISYWMDEEGIYSGDEFAKIIAQYIRQSLIFLFISTANSNGSEWTSDEIATARMYKKKIIPFKYDDSFYNEEVIIFIAKLDFIDYLSSPEHALTKLVASIKKYKADVEDAKKRERELYEKRLQEEAERKKRAEEEAKKEKVRLEIKEKANECQHLIFQQEVIVRQLYDKNVFVGNENKECPICKKIAAIDAPFCDRCSFQFPLMYAIDGNDVFSFDNRLLTIAKTNYDSLHFLGDENEHLKQVCAEQKESLNRISEECEKHHEVIEKTKLELAKKDEKIKELQELRTRIKESQNKVEELEIEKQTLADSIAKLEKEIENLKSQANNATEVHPQSQVFGSIEGSIKGVFSVSPTKKVYFSKGNLQYQALSNTWRFAEKQFDVIGQSNSNISFNNIGWIDLFGWGTGDNPIKASKDSADYTKFTDWGNNKISNGGNQEKIWRTMTREEWIYVLEERQSRSGIRFAKAKVNGVNGLLLLPDDYGERIIIPWLMNANRNDADFEINKISKSDFLMYEEYGVVFLPAAGYRNGTIVESNGSNGYYWSASCIGSDRAYELGFFYGYLSASDADGRRCGHSVRLVCPTEI